MVIKVENIRKKKANYFMTTEEAKILWQYSKRWSSKFQVMVGLALFRGMRIGEICACNIYDFQNDNFQKLNIILEKSHIRDEFPILAEFNELLKDYVLKNKHMMKDGYLFPFYNSNKYSVHMTTKCAEALLAKLRKTIGKDHPSFLENTPSENNPNYRRYRIGWHSCRRWFETRIWERYKDKMLLRDVMRYSSSKVVDVYIDPYETWKREHELLQDTFGELFQEFNVIGKGQTKLTMFLNNSLR